jgi:hypothetical protein
MLDESSAAELQGSTLLDADGHEVGEIAEVFTFPAEDHPALASVATADGRHVLVPLDEVDIDHDHVTVRFHAEDIEHAPDAPDDHISAEDAEAAYEHYGIAAATLRDDAGLAVDDDEEHASLDALRDDEHAADVDDDDE